MNSKRLFRFGKDRLTASTALRVASGELTSQLDKEMRQKVKACHAVVARIASGTAPVYGINTGFGPLCQTAIPQDETSQLQYNILMSHAVGVGGSSPQQIAKLMLILKAHSLAFGFSGVAETTIDRIIWHIHNDIIPVVPSKGSVGASGDLAPLAHLFLPLIGLGQVVYEGRTITAAEALQRNGMDPISLGAKEGLALINGTQFITAYAVFVLDKLHSCLSHGDILGAMMIDGLLGSVKPFRPELHQLRPYAGNEHVARRVSALLAGSDLVASHAGCARVQDPYSLRCIPQVHGASRNAWLHLKQMLEIELNAVTDNPVIFSDELTISGGNFHGQPLALPLDYACLAASEIGNISDRRIYLALMGSTPPLPKLLVEKAGTNSGLMLLQYTSAALASENKGLCFPASADSIPTSLGQEDHVSMGSISGRKALDVVENVQTILAIEMICATQTLDFHLPLKPGPIISQIYEFIRSQINFIKEDRIFAVDIEAALTIIKDKTLLDIANDAAARYQPNYRTDYHELFEVY